MALCPFNKDGVMISVEANLFLLIKGRSCLYWSELSWKSSNFFLAMALAVPEPKS